MSDCLPQPEEMAAPPTTMTATAYLVFEARRGRSVGGFTKYAGSSKGRLAGALYRVGRWASARGPSADIRSRSGLTAPAIPGVTRRTGAGSDQSLQPANER